MPVAVVARQPGCFQRKDGSCFAIADCRQQAAEARTLPAAGAGNPKIFIDDHDLPKTKFSRPLLQRILPATAFQIMADLLQRGLANINIGSASELLIPNLIAHALL